MVEAFVAEHNVTPDEVLYEWPSSKFEAFYAAFSRRKVAAELVARKGLEIAAMWGNPNLDNEKDPYLRQKMMQEIEQNYTKTITALYGGGFEEENDIDEDDPFWQAAKRGTEKHKLPSAEDMR